MTDRQIRDNLMSMIVAGHETTTGELAWAFQLLAHNPGVQERLIEEIDDGGGEEYLTATVHETLRRKPVFLFTIPRKVVEPIEIGGWTYRPPVHLAGCTYLMHHNPELYPEPHGSARSGSSTKPSSRAPGCRGEEVASTASAGTSRCWSFRASCARCSPRGGCCPPAIASSARWRSAILVPPGGGRVILSEASFPGNVFVIRVSTF